MVHTPHVFVAKLGQAVSSERLTHMLRRRSYTLGALQEHHEKHSSKSSEEHHVSSTITSNPLPGQQYGQQGGIGNSEPLLVIYALGKLITITMIKKFAVVLLCIQHSTFL